MGNTHPAKAETLAVLRRRSAKKYNKKSENLLMVLKEWLLLGWLPEAISFRFTVELPSSCRVCHSTLYNWIEADRTAGGKLYTLLPRFGKRCRKGGKRKRAGVHLIPDRVGVNSVLKLWKKGVVSAIGKEILFMGKMPLWLPWWSEPAATLFARESGAKAKRRLPPLSTSYSLLLKGEKRP